MKAVMILIVVEEPKMIGGPLKGDTKKGVEDYQMEEIIVIENILEEEDPLIEIKDPQMVEDHLMMEDPLMVEDPLMMEDPLEMEKSKIPWRIRTTQSTRTPWTSETYYSATAPGNFRHHSFRKHVWYGRTVHVAFG